MLRCPRSSVVDKKKKKRKMNYYILFLKQYRITLSQLFISGHFRPLIVLKNLTNKPGYKRELNLI